MLIDCVDSNNQPKGTVVRSKLFETSCGFRTVHVFVVNRNGELLIQRVVQQNSHPALLWGSSVAAYLFAGESYEDAAKRRLSQELGLNVSRLNIQKIIPMQDLGHEKFVGFTTIVSEGPFVIDIGNVETVRFVSVQSLQRDWQQGSIALTPTFAVLFQHYLKLRATNTELLKS